MRAPWAVAVSAVLFARTVMADGTLDPSFGNGGIVTTVFTGTSGTRPAIPCAAALQADGRIVVARPA